jgi:chorismate mutase
LTNTWLNKGKDMAKAKKTEKQDVVETPVQEPVQKEQVQEEQVVQEATQEPDSAEPVVRQISSTKYEVEFPNGTKTTFRREGGRYVKSSISSSTIEGLVSRLAKLPNRT